MGGNIAGNLLKNDFNVIGFDILPDRMAALDELGLEKTASVTEVAERADVLISSLPNAGALENVVEGVLRHDKPGQILIECSTLTVEQKLAAHEKASIYVSGDESAYNSVQSVLKGFTATSFYVGDVGNGSRMKFLANYLVHVHVTAAAECIVMGEKAGLDPTLVHTVLKESAGSSKMFEIRGAMMAKSDYREGGGTMFAVYEKDASVITEFAASVQSPIDLYVSSRQKFNSAIALGLDHLDTSAVCKAIETAAGIDRKLVE
jgi:3-hydroxyisobutyrate dehydrogenase